MITNLDEYKAHVLEVARRVKEEEGWCDTGFTEVMKELEIEIPPQYFELRMTVEIIVRGQRTDSLEEPTDEFVATSVNSIEVAMDGDWSDEYVESYDITSVEVQRIDDL